jgi:hypothetical protein
MLIALIIYHRQPDRFLIIYLNVHWLTSCNHRYILILVYLIFSCVKIALREKIHFNSLTRSDFPFSENLRTALNFSSVDLISILIQSF